MKTNIFFPINILMIILTSSLLSACNTLTSPAVPSAVPADSASAQVTAPTASKPDWFGIALTDVRTGKAFTMNDFAGKVVLIETIAQWCPSCIFQQAENRNLRKLLGNPADLILVSLDVDTHEDEPSLKKYTDDFGFDWFFAVTPLEVAREIGRASCRERVSNNV
jgi:cytochrome oxidase Cu insertion factor (SCO1/SenC/PrrC family)